LSIKNWPLKTSIDCGYFEDTIKAYNRLLDIKEKYVDIEVLAALAKSVENNLCDPNQVPISKHKQKILELFGRLTSVIFLYVLYSIEKKK
jgi:hypothetical protein